MRQSSRIIIKRQTQNDIYLWKKSEGYFETSGREICYEVYNLIVEYTSKQLQQMVENIKLVDEDYFGEYQQNEGFDINDLTIFIEGDLEWFMDKRKVQFEYTIDVYNQIVIGEEIGEKRIMLTFDEIRNKMNFYKKEMELNN